LKGNPNGPHYPTHIVLTGQFSDPWHERAELEFYLNDLGFIPRGNISGKTKILVTGTEAGQAKIEDALSRGIKVMTEAQFFAFLDGR
jgi:NAD-dependent DNA ligase